MVLQIHSTIQMERQKHILQICIVRSCIWTPQVLTHEELTRLQEIPDPFYKQPPSSQTYKIWSEFQVHVQLFICLLNAVYE